MTTVALCGDQGGSWATGDMSPHLGADMDTETLNEYLFADLVTTWAIRIALSRATVPASASASDAENSVTTEDLRAALARLELRRSVVRALREALPLQPPV
jgi:hypothetical protein